MIYIILIYLLFKISLICLSVVSLLEILCSKFACYYFMYDDFKILNFDLYYNRIIGLRLEFFFFDSEKSSELLE